MLKVKVIYESNHKDLVKIFFKLKIRHKNIKIAKNTQDLFKQRLQH